VLEEVRARIVRILQALPHPGNATLLDVGCWDGACTIQYGAAVKAARVLGVEVFHAQALEAKRRGVEVGRINLERDRFPWADESVDHVVCNQVLEHLKNVWLPLSEMHRVLKPGGVAVLSVPNLASLHNRLLLAIGRQPTSIRTFGPHVRGYTFREFVGVVTFGGAFDVVRTEGVGFPPLAPPWSSPLSRLFPRAAHTAIVVARRTTTPAAWRAWLEQQRQEGVQTVFEDSVSPAVG